MSDRAAVFVRLTPDQARKLDVAAAVVPATKRDLIGGLVERYVDPETEEGRLLRRLQLPDSVLGPALQAMLTEVTEDGVPGSVDFRSLQVREFGTIYEGLLESSLSLADSDLTLDARGGDEAVEPTRHPLEAGGCIFRQVSARFA